MEPGHVSEAPNRISIHIFLRSTCQNRYRLRTTMHTVLNQPSCEDYLREIHKGRSDRESLLSKTALRTEWIFKIVARHQYPIPDGSYTLLGDISFDNSTLCWVVGWRLSDQRLKKLSVFEMYEEDMGARPAWNHWCHRASLQRLIIPFLLDVNKCQKDVHNAL